MMDPMVEDLWEDQQGTGAEGCKKTGSWLGEG